MIILTTWRNFKKEWVYLCQKRVMSLTLVVASTKIKLYDTVKYASLPQ